MSLSAEQYEWLKKRHLIDKQREREQRKEQYDNWLEHVIFNKTTDSSNWSGTISAPMTYIVNPSVEEETKDVVFD